MRYFPEFALQTGESIIPHLYSVAAAATIIAAPRVKAEGYSDGRIGGPQISGLYSFCCRPLLFHLTFTNNENAETCES